MTKKVEFTGECFAYKVNPNIWNGDDYMIAFKDPGYHVLDLEKVLGSFAGKVVRITIEELGEG